jgi:hypothetical protein
MRQEVGLGWYSSSHCFHKIDLVLSEKVVHKHDMVKDPVEVIVQVIVRFGVRKGNSILQKNLTKVSEQMQELESESSIDVGRGMHMIPHCDPVKKLVSILHDDFQER